MLIVNIKNINIKNKHNDKYFINLTIFTLFIIIFYKQTNK